ncbi:hypothetical protein BGX33_009021 [Mortierella sp. NVP41]|nr:hypothetical protein BGX33_009021 [Mortierella sp. NVP41]
MSRIISKNKFSILSDNGNTNAPSTMNTTDACQTVHAYTRIQSKDSQESNDNHHFTASSNKEQSFDSEDDGEWVVKSKPARRQPRRRPSHRNNNNTNNSNNDDYELGWSYTNEDSEDDDDGYMSLTEHELSKHVKAMQLKNIRTHPGVPMVCRRTIK